jgi:soluble lytic murein transglycosylase-like protein
MNLRHFFSFLFIAVVVSISVQYLPGQGFYSYIDENGVQVFTNIPPIQIEESSDSIALEKDTPENSNSNAFDSIINKYADYYQLDPSLIHSIIATESGFNPNAVSSKGACGLMQLMPETANRLGVKDRFDPEQNIHAGIRHFRSLMDMFDNNLDLSLAAYNAGENLVLRLGRIPSYKETINYVQSVISRYREKLANALDPMDSSNSLTFRYFDAAGVLHVTNIPPNN